MAAFHSAGSRIIVCGVTASNTVLRMAKRQVLRRSSALRTLS